MLLIHLHFLDNNQSRQHLDKQLVQMVVREVVLEEVQPLGLPHHLQQVLSLEAELLVNRRFSEHKLLARLLHSLEHLLQSQQDLDQVCLGQTPLQQGPALHLHLDLHQHLVRDSSEIIRHNLLVSHLQHKVVCLAKLNKPHS